MTRLRIDRGLRVVTLDVSGPYFLPTLSEVARWGLKITGCALAAGIVYAAGRAHEAVDGSQAVLDARRQAAECVDGLDESTRQTARTLVYLDSSHEVVASFLGQHPAPRIDYTVTEDR